MSKKIILLLGLVGSGKSTIGNCLLNQSPDISQIDNPFMTDSGANGSRKLCEINGDKTDHYFRIKETSSLIIIDTIGYGDPNIDSDMYLKDLRKGIETVKNRIDIIIYVLQKGRIIKNDDSFFQTFQKEFNKFPPKNVLLIVTKCEKGWVKRQNNPVLRKILENCDYKYTEFNMRFDRDDDPPDSINYNRNQRQITINDLVICVHQLFMNTHKYKNILLIGNTGRGKSTTGNCLVNQSPKSDHIHNGPFVTSDGASGCTQSFQIEKLVKQKLKIIDTVGFGDPNIDYRTCLHSLKKAVESVGSQIDLIIFLFQKGRLRDIDVQFFEMARNELKSFTDSRSLLLVTKCEKGWVKENVGKSEDLKEALDNCHGNYLEFNLFFDNVGELDHERKDFNKNQRKS